MTHDEQHEALKAFALDMAACAYEGEPDGKDIQHYLARHRLVTQEKYDPEKHGHVDDLNIEGVEEPGDLFCLIAGWLLEETP